MLLGGDRRSPWRPLLGALIFVWSRNERMQELQREAGEDALTGLQEPAPLRGGGAGGDGARAARRHHRGAADARPRPLQAGQRHPRPPGRRPADRGGRRACCAGAPARATSSPGSAATSSRSSLPRCGRDEANVGRRSDRRPRSASTSRDDDGVEPVTASVGVAIFGADPPMSYATLVSEADTAMYAAKDGGRDGFRVFDPEAIREDAPDARLGGRPAAPARGAVAAPAAAEASKRAAAERAARAAGRPAPAVAGSSGARRSLKSSRSAPGGGRRRPPPSPGRRRRATAARAERVGDRDAAEAEPAAQLAGGDRPA